MNTIHRTLLVALASAASGFIAAPAASQSQGYLTDGRNAVSKNSYNQCWRTSEWTPKMATLECDPDLVPKPAPRVVTAPPPPPVAKAAPPPPVVIPPRVEKIALSGDAHFDFGKAELTPKGIAELDGYFKGKGKPSEVDSIVITGHTDNVGPADFNQQLSLRRAEAVKAFAISRGVDGSKIQTVGRGETQPIADNKTAEGRARNRRVDVEIRGTRTVP